VSCHRSDSRRPHGVMGREARQLLEQDEPENPDDPSPKPPPVDPNLTQEEIDAHIRRRSCTDVLCAVLFAVAIFFLIEVILYAWEFGDTRRLYHGLNWENQLCGVDPQVVDKPYLYWCAKPGDVPLTQADMAADHMPLSMAAPSGDVVHLIGTILSPSQSMDLMHPICLASCPQDRSTFHPCLQEIKLQEQVPRDPDGSFWRNNTFLSDFVQDIATYTFAQRFCLPKDNFLVEQMNETLSGSMNAVMYKASEIMEARKMFAIAGVLAIGLCYVYLFAIDLLAAPIIYLVLIIATFGSFAVSAYFFYAAFRIELGSALAIAEEALPLVESLSDRNWDIAVGSIMAVVGIATLCFWCCKRNAISFVIAAVKASVRILYDVPQLILLPAGGAIFRAIALIIFLWGLALIVSVGDIEHVDISAYVPKGVARSFRHSSDETLYIAYYSFCCLWMWELLLALETFVASYAVVVWFNSPLVEGKKRVPCFPVVRAFFVGMTYHLGSLLFGAVILAIFRAAYILASLLESQVRGDKEDENGASRTAAACCCCCLQCVEQILRYLSKGAYVMIAVNSDSFCTGADRALRLMSSNVLELGLLNGATVLFQVLGNVAIPGVTGYVIYLLATHVEFFSDPISDHFVANPDMVAVIAGLVGLAISMAFMSVFDTVSDAMIFAYMTDDEWRKEMRLPPNPNIPENLKKLLEEAKQ